MEHSRISGRLDKREGKRVFVMAVLLTPYHRWRVTGNNDLFATDGAMEGRLLVRLEQ
jgi:hypothetical protein